MTHFRLARLILFWGFLLNLAFCLVCIFLDLDYPWTTFLFRPLDRFQDFFAVYRSTAALDPYEVRPVIDIPGHSGVEMSNYLPLTHILFYPLTWVDQDSALMIFLGLSVAAFSYAFWKMAQYLHLSKLDTALSWFIFVPFCYPILFTWDRGNLECWVFMSVAYGIYMITKGRDNLGALAIALAGAIKIFPLLFLFPLFIRGKFKPLLIAAAAFVGATWISLMMFEGTVMGNIEALHSALFSFSNFLLFWVNGITHSIGLFSGIYSAVIYYNQNFTNATELKVWVDRYNIFVLITLASILLYIWRARIERWKEWMLLVGAIQLLPFPSYDYRLLYSLIPLTFAVTDPTIKVKYVWLLALTVVPKVVPFMVDVRIGNFLNPILILTTMVMVIGDGQTPPETASAQGVRRSRSKADGFSKRAKKKA